MSEISRGKCRIPARSLGKAFVTLCVIQEMLGQSARTVERANHGGKEVWGDRNRHLSHPCTDLLVAWAELEMHLTAR